MQIIDSNPIIPARIPTVVTENSGTCRRNVAYNNLRCSQIISLGLITFYLQEFQSEGATHSIEKHLEKKKHLAIFAECQNTTKKIT